MKTLTGGLAALLMLGTIAQADPYEFDSGHTEVRFYYDHAGLTEQSGQWKVVGGTVVLDPDNLDATQINVTVAVDSIDTGVEGIDNHLKTADFFDVATYPDITFVSTGVTRTGEKTVVVSGDLTIKGTTRPLDLDFTLTHMGPHPAAMIGEYYAGNWIAAQGTATLKRSDFGVDLFVPLVSDEIRLEISAEMREGGWN